MKTIIALVCSFLIYSGTLSSQILLKLPDSKLMQNHAGLNSLKFKSSSSEGPIVFTAIFLAIINPELVIENKKAYFGLTKELSVGKYPYGRLAFEYTHVFRSYSRNHLRFSYNQDYIFPTHGDFIAFYLSGGVGYFTDTEHSGIFPQVSVGAIVPFPTPLFDGVMVYLKGRHTFVKGTENSNITDFSVGMSFLLFY